MYKEPILTVIRTYLQEAGLEAETDNTGRHLFYITPKISYAIRVSDGAIIIEKIGDPYAKRISINLADPNSLEQLAQRLKCDPLIKLSKI